MSLSYMPGSFLSLFKQTIASPLCMMDTTNKSTNQEYVVVVDENDNAIGLAEKMDAHVNPVMHRAFSVFIFNSDKQLLLQRRALGKYHSPGLWTNTCCSHPRQDETILDAARRRMREEMGMCCNMEEAFSFTYKADVGQGLTEHEFDHVLIGHSNDSPHINPDEVDSIRYATLEEISKEINERPEQFTMWFKIVFNRLVKHFNSLQ